MNIFFNLNFNQFKKNVGNIAINDAFYLFALVYKIINLFLRNHLLYPKFYELFTEVSIQIRLNYILLKLVYIYFILKVNVSTIIGQGNL